IPTAKLSELELKKILMDKMEKKKSIDRLTRQKNLYNALVEAYEADKDILETYEDTVTFKRRQDDHDEDEEPSIGLKWGSKRRRAGKEPESTSAPKERTSKTTGKSTEGSKSYHKSAGQSAQAEEPMYTAEDLEEPTRQEFEIGVTEDQPREDPRESFDELMDTPLDFSAFVMNRLNVDTLTPELLAGLTFKLMKGTCKSLVKLEYFFEEVYKATTEKLDWNNPEGQQLQKASPSRQQRYADLSCLRQADKSQYKKNKLMRVDELHKFSDETLNDVRTAPDDRLKGLGWSIYHRPSGERVTENEQQL
ncbi:hypothetical protein Tco_0936337, partial [Tanacetum coccineum]